MLYMWNIQRFCSHPTEVYNAGISMNDVWVKHFCQSYYLNERKDVYDGSADKFGNEKCLIAETSSVRVDAHLKRYNIGVEVVLNEYIIDSILTRYDKKRSYTFRD